MDRMRMTIRKWGKNTRKKDNTRTKTQSQPLLCDNLFYNIG